MYAVNCSAMKNFDPKKYLQKEYNDKLYYNYLIYSAISQGQHDVVSKFLKKVTSFEEKGDKIYSFTFVFEQLDQWRC